MCGIAGGYTEPLAKEQIVAALEAIQHRGPDDYGLHQEAGIFIGMRRLSIIDLAGGHQPIYNEDGNIGVCFNGEIYNYIELIPDLIARGHVFETRSDTEVLVHLYEEYGTGMCRFLRGMFAFVILDKRKKQLFVARDHFGKKPVYYTRTSENGLIFGSELKALRVLAEATHTRLNVSEQAIYDFLSLGVPPQPTTIYENVFMLPPGAWMTFDGENLVIERYWQPDYTRKTKISYDEALEQVRALIAEAVRIRLRSDVPLGVLLSGGINSSIVAYEASRELGGSLKTFTVSVDDPELNEADVARRTAQAFGVQNEFLTMKIDPSDTLQYLVRQYDQPFADPSAIPSLAVSRLARKHVTVVLNGDGGDELFAGYRRHLATAMVENLDWIPAPAAKMAANALNMVAPGRRSALGHAARLARTLASTQGERYLVRTADMLMEEDKREIWRGGRVRSTESWIEGVDPCGSNELDIQLSRDVQIILLSSLLVKMDIATMASSLEGRSPLLDYKLAEFAMSLPSNYLLHGQTTKSLLRDAYKGKLPEEVLKGKKKGFEIPLMQWLDTDLQPMINDLLKVKSAKLRHYIADEYIDRVLAGEIMQDRNRGYLIYSLLILELWLREFGSH